MLEADLITSAPYLNVPLFVAAQSSSQSELAGYSLRHELSHMFSLCRLAHPNGLPSSLQRINRRRRAPSAELPIIIIIKADRSSRVFALRAM
jgi:hypothetical protein